jgi:DNA polymerase III delta prime subunit
MASGSTDTRLANAPHLLLFGPSGAGKSTLAAALSEKLGWLYIETDPLSRTADAVACPNNLSSLFAADSHFDDLIPELRETLPVAPCQGAVLSFASVVTPSIEQIDAACRSGLTALYVFGEEEDCLHSFLYREASSGRNLPESHWRAYNTRIFEVCREPEYHPHLLHAFREGIRRSVDDLVAEVRSRCAGYPPPDENCRPQSRPDRRHANLAS